MGAVINDEDGGGHSRPAVSLPECIIAVDNPRPKVKAHILDNILGSEKPEEEANTGRAVTCSPNPVGTLFWSVVLPKSC
jgi:hypothetical protein